VKDVRLTHIGGRTLLIEAAGWRLLTDPTFDPPGDAIPSAGARKHFKESREDIEREFARAQQDIRRRFRWLPIGIAE
jgi:L-ascorbate metabolism protein UlaG (beta-lactamase superfamily)